MGNKKYPTEMELEKIRKWDVIKDPIGLIEFIRDRWMFAEDGYFKVKGKRVIKLELHTAGWSGNEDIIEALERNGTFFLLYWQKSTRGGHYYFRIENKLDKIGNKIEGRKKGEKSLEDVECED